jgi:uncharacterized repeat protein (TIGR03837 family)
MRSLPPAAKPFSPLPAAPPRRWDIFCQVIDNFGDAGVCWRLARQLAGEYGFAVRLWVDDLAPLHRLFPALDPSRESQVCLGVEVRRWTPAFPQTEAADGVIEAFGCRLPERYVAAMAARAPKLLWINLEYLSAENWVEGCHGLPSPHPALPLVKYFFFPGFSAQTGGLLREADLLARRDAFQGAAGEKAAFWAALGWVAPAPDALTVSLFCYANLAVPALLATWAESPSPVVCCVAEGKPAAAVAAALGRASLAPGETVQSGNLTLRILPFLEQDTYDRLLWACDCNFVRGEDSFVRAQWAGKPLVWQAYPQEEDAHEAKLAAFLKRYCAALPEDDAAALRRLWLGWNRGTLTAPLWEDWCARRAMLERHARAWADGLAKNSDLAAALVNFCNTMIK